MADLYLDADIKPSYHLLLQMRWHNIVTSQERDQLNASDGEQLITATNLGRLLVTHNGKDYRNLCQAWRVWRRVWELPAADHAGVIAIPQSISLAVSEATRQIDRLIESQQPLWNALWYFEVRVGEWVRQV